MPTPETLDQTPYTEIPLQGSHRFLQAFAASSLVCQEKDFSPRVFAHPTDPLDQELYAWVWTLDETGTDGSWRQIQVSWHERPEDTESWRESLAVELILPIAENGTQIMKFHDDVNDGWMAWVETQAGHRPRPTYSMHSMAQGPDTACAYLNEGDDEKTLILTLEDMWEKGYNTDPRDQLSLEDYAHQIAERLSELAWTVPAYAHHFTKYELAKLNRKQEIRLRTKPPAWPRQALVNMHATHIESAWATPEHGTEPRMAYTKGAIEVDGMNYECTIESVESVDHDDPLWPGRFQALFFFPPQLNTELKNNPDLIETQWDEYARTLDRTPDQFLSNTLLKPIFNIYMLPPLEKGSEPLTAFGFEVLESRLRKLLTAGYTRETILGECIALVKRIHPMIVDFINNTSR